MRAVLIDLITAAFLIVLLPIISSCKDDDTPLRKNIIKVEPVSVVVKSLKESETNLGTLNYISKHNVSSLVSGRVEKIYAKEGKAVNKGDLLAVLRNIQLENQKEMLENTLSEAESSLRIAEDNLKADCISIEKQIRNLDKLKLQIQQEKVEYEYKRKCHENNLELGELGGISPLRLKEEELQISQLQTSISILEKELEINSIGFRDVDLLNNGYEIPESSINRTELLIDMNTCQGRNLVNSEKSKVDNARKNLASIQNLLDELNIRASVSGIIGASNFQIGDHVDENQTVFIIIDTSCLNGVFYVQEKEVWKYRINDGIQVNVPSLEESLSSFICEISPMADPVSGNFCIKTKITNNDNHLKPGMFISCIRKSDEEKNYLAIPETSVVYKKNEESGVYVISADHVFFKTIQIADKENGFVYLEKGLKENDIIVDHPSVFLREGDAVEIN
ncbi:efflux RND transporter periplasmic adaptor subunit [Treponema sp.]|uniref:efflux RND transporter periplasmic adaptor subunit n=1 Tax=Treponema sp. TaxID=166 RepID=UPI00388E1B95